MTGRRHPFDNVASELVDWIQRETPYYVEAMRAGNDTPFSAPVSEEQKREYYTRQMFMQNPDGSIDYSKPNSKGRDQLIRLVGIEGYAQIAKAVMPPRSVLMHAEAEQASVPEEPMLPDMGM